MSNIRNGIQDFLESRKASSSFLINLWSKDLETQYLVHPGSVETEEGSKRWTDGQETWADHRWPYNAGSNPNYKDRTLTFSPGAHLSRIGSTWWNWKSKRSVAVSFDIDMEGDGHAATTTTVTEKELDAVVKRLKELPYVTAVRSTGGRGVHVYVVFDPQDQPEAANHNEHTQVALATLSKMSKDAKYQFSQHMDVKGVITWFWADTSPEGHPGFDLIFEQTESLRNEDIKDLRADLLNIPNRTKTVTGYDDEGQPADTEASSGGYKVFDLEEEHKVILRELEELDYSFIWNKEFNMVHTNTRALRELFDKRKKSDTPLRGMFATTSQGHVSKPNCYMTPRPGGVFQVKRFGNGIAEHPSWNVKEDSTWCFFNQAAPVRTVLQKFCSKEGQNTFTFEPTELEDAMKSLGHNMEGTLSSMQSAITVTRKRDGTFFATCTDQGVYEGWHKTKKGQSRTLPMVEEDEVREHTLLEDIDEFVRYVVTPQYVTYGWALKTTLGWIMHKNYDYVGPKISHTFGKEANYVRSLMTDNPWVMCNIPFGPEYPQPDEKKPEVDRLWNYASPQLSITPSEDVGPHPHWDMVYSHLGKSLDEAVARTDWCQKWGMANGGDYLRFWMAALIQYPFEPLPYLFFYGPQNSGKSMFHESIAMIFSPDSVKSAKGALTNTSDFNFEIARCVIGFVEEKDMSSVKDAAYSKMKEWITSKTMCITEKGKTPYTQPNILKMVQMANSPTAVAMEDGDTRITALAVELLKNLIPKKLMDKNLESEAPFFLRTLLTTMIPESPDRLRVPMLVSQDKVDLENMSMKPWEEIASEMLIPCSGSSVKFSAFYEKYVQRCEFTSQKPHKTRALLQLLRNRGDKYTIGSGKGKQLYVANVKLFGDDDIPSTKLVLTDAGRLVRCTE